MQGLYAGIGLGLFIAYAAERRAQWWASLTPAQRADYIASEKAQAEKQENARHAWLADRERAIAARARESWLRRRWLDRCDPIPAADAWRYSTPPRIPGAQSAA